MIAGSTEPPDVRFRRMFNELYPRLVRSLLREFRRLSEEDARDIAQDAFVRVLKSMSDPIHNEWALLRVTARRLAINEVTRNVPGLDLEAVPTPTDSRPDPEESLLDREMVERLADCIEALPEGTRICLLHRQSGLKYAAIAALLGVSIDAVKSRLHYAREKLRECVGVDPPPEQAGEEDD